MAAALITTTDAELRVWVDEGAKWGDPYQVAARVRWRPTEPGAVDLTLAMATAPITRSMVRAVLSELLRHGVQRAYTTRFEGGLMPGGQLQPNGSVMVDVQALAERIAPLQTEGDFLT